MDEFADCYVRLLGEDIPGHRFLLKSLPFMAGLFATGDRMKKPELHAGDNLPIYEIKPDEWQRYASVEGFKCLYAHLTDSLNQAGASSMKCPCASASVHALMGAASMASFFSHETLETHLVSSMSDTVDRLALEVRPENMDFNIKPPESTEREDNRHGPWMQQLYEYHMQHDREKMALDLLIRACQVCIPRKWLDAIQVQQVGTLGSLLTRAIHSGLVWWPEISDWTKSDQLSFPSLGVRNCMGKGCTGGKQFHALTLQEWTKTEVFTLQFFTETILRCIHQQMKKVTGKFAGGTNTGAAMTTKIHAFMLPCNKEDHVTVSIAFSLTAAASQRALFDRIIRNRMTLGWWCKQSGGAVATWQDADPHTVTLGGHGQFVQLGVSYNGAPKKELLFKATFVVAWAMKIDSASAGQVVRMWASLEDIPKTSETCEDTSSSSSSSSSLGEKRKADDSSPSTTSSAKRQET